jgi:hypothetical protein
MNAGDVVRTKLAWALMRENVTFQAEIRDDTFSTFQSRITFAIGLKRRNVALPLEWLDDCDPERDYVTPELRGLLREVERELA